MVLTCREIRQTKEEEMRVKITVYCDDGDHVAMRCLPGAYDFTPAGEEFSIEEEIASTDEIERVEALAKKEARKCGIPHVVNLD